MVYVHEISCVFSTEGSFEISFLFRTLMVSPLTIIKYKSNPENNLNVTKFMLHSIHSVYTTNR